MTDCTKNLNLAHIPELLDKAKFERFHILKYLFLKTKIEILHYRRNRICGYYLYGLAFMIEEFFSGLLA